MSTSGRLPDPASVGLDFENVTYGDGLPAWYVAGDPGRPVIVVVHGYGGNRTATVEVGPPLHRLGYGLLFVDLGYVSGDRRYGGGEREADEVERRRPLGGRDRARARRPARVLRRGVRVAGRRGPGRPSGGGRRRQRLHRASAAWWPSGPTCPEIVTNLLPVLYPLVSDGGHAVDVARELDERPFDVPAFVIQGTGDRTIPPSDGPAPGPAHRRPAVAAARRGPHQGLRHRPGGLRGQGRRVRALRGPRSRLSQPGGGRRPVPRCR